MSTSSREGSRPVSPTHAQQGHPVVATATQHYIEHFQPSLFEDTTPTRSVELSFFQRNKPLIKGVVGISLGAMGGAYCALVLASVITGALAISTTLATAGLALAAILILAGIAALVKQFNSQNTAAKVQVPVLTPSSSPA